MNPLELTKRFRQKRDSDRTQFQIQMAIASNPAVISIYAGKDSETGLTRSLSADGSSIYSRQIFVKDLAIGDVVPVTLQGANGSGFVDGLSD